MLKTHKYHRKDFSNHNKTWKGKPRDIDLSGWIFDRFCNAFYKKLPETSERDTLCVSYIEKSDSWSATFASAANIIWNFDAVELADVLDAANAFYNDYFIETVPKKKPTPKKPKIVVKEKESEKKTFTKEVTPKNDFDCASYSNNLSIGISMGMPGVF